MKKVKKMLTKEEMESRKAYLSELNIRIGRAEQNHNDETEYKFLQEVLSEKLQFTRANGDKVNKEEYFAQLKDRTYDTMDTAIESVTVTPFDTLALVKVLVKTSGKTGNEPFAGTYRNTRTWGKEDDNIWKVILWFNEKIKTRKH